MAKTGKTTSAGLVAAAKRFTGDEEQEAITLTPEEEAMMSADRQGLPRPSNDEIREAAKRLIKK